MDGTSPGTQPPLVRAFVELGLLPDLLHAYRLWPDEWLARWTALLDETGYSEDHVDDRHVAGDIDLTTYMAQDAMGLCRRIQLVDRRLTAVGRDLANIALTPARQRDAAAYQTLAARLAHQIQRHYLGANGLAVAHLLQSASAVLASPAYPWRRTLGGLLLVEMEALVHAAFHDAARANTLVSELPEIRTRARNALLREKVPDAVNPRGGVFPEVLADAVAALHLSDPRLVQQSTLTTTELRATAITLTFAELLVEVQYGFVVHVLRPSVPSGHGR